jgi:hypothetical protein
MVTRKLSGQACTCIKNSSIVKVGWLDTILGVDTGCTFILVKVGKEYAIKVARLIYLLPILLLSSCGIGGGVNADSNAGDFVTGETRNLMRLNGVDAFDNQGNSISLHAFAVELLNHFETIGGATRTFTKSELQISEEPGNTLDRLLNEFFTDQDAITVVKEELIGLAETDPATNP